MCAVEPWLSVLQLAIPNVIVPVCCFNSWSTIINCIICNRKKIWCRDIVQSCCFFFFCSLVGHTITLENVYYRSHLGGNAELACNRAFWDMFRSLSGWSSSCCVGKPITLRLSAEPLCCGQRGNRIQRSLSLWVLAVLARIDWMVKFQTAHAVNKYKSKKVLITYLNYGHSLFCLL